MLLRVQLRLQRGGGVLQLVLRVLHVRAGVGQLLLHGLLGFRGVCELLFQQRHAVVELRDGVLPLSGRVRQLLLRGGHLRLCARRGVLGGSQLFLQLCDGGGGQLRSGFGRLQLLPCRVCRFALLQQFFLYSFLGVHGVRQLFAQLLLALFELLH